MTRTLCLQTSLRHDIRFRRLLTNHEKWDFVTLLSLAAEGRDPSYIHPRKAALLAKEFGYNAEKMERRLTKWAAPDIELIERQDDGGILIGFLLEGDAEGDLPAGEPVDNYSLAISQNEHSPNGNGASPRQPRKPRSNSEDSFRSRKSYWKKQGFDYLPDGTLHELSAQETSQEPLSSQNGQNLTVSESEPHTFAVSNGTISHTENDQNREVVREVSPVRVGDVQNVVRGSKEFKSSDYVSNVAETSHPTLSSQPETSQNSNPPNPTAQPVSARGPAAPPPRPPLAPHQLALARREDVRAVMSEVGDGQDWSNQWHALWKHCQANDLLRCWDQAIVIYAWRLKVSPPSGPGSIGRKGPFLRGAILTLLREEGVPYVSKAEAKADAEAQGPVDAAETEGIRREVQEIKALWAAEEAQRLGAITPLTDITAEIEGEYK